MISNLIIILIFIVLGIGYLDFGLLKTIFYIILLTMTMLKIMINIANKHRIKFETKLTFFLLILISIAIFKNFNEKQAEIYNYLTGILVFISLSFDEKLNYKYILNVVIIFSFIQLFLGWLQFFLPNIFDSIFSSYLHGDNSFSNYHRKIGRLTSYWLEAPRFATILIGLLPFIFYYFFTSKNLIYLTLILACSLLVFLTFTRIAIFSLILLYMSIIFYFAPQKKLINELFIILTLFIMYLTINFYITDLPFKTFQRVIDPIKLENELLDKYDNYNRIYIIKQLLPLTLQYPLLGSGRLYKNFLLFNFSSVHNSVLQFILMFGYLSAIIFFYIIFRNLKNILFNFFKVHGFVLVSGLALSSIMIVGMFHSILLDGTINLFFWFLLCLVSNEYKKVKLNFND